MKNKLPEEISCLKDLDLILKNYRVYPYSITESIFQLSTEVHIKKMRLWQIFRRKRLDICMQHVRWAKPLSAIINFTIIYKKGNNNE